MKTTNSLQLYGNKKLLDCKVGRTTYKYAQFNTRAVTDCPFASSGCKVSCYAISGCHRFPSVKAAREASYNETMRADFAKRMTDTIESSLASGRYKGSKMILRLHESGDFYSMEYLKKWIAIFNHFRKNDNIVFCFYTKSFKFFLQLDDNERNILNGMMKKGIVAMSLSLDDTTDEVQRIRYGRMRKTYPLANTYYATDDIGSVKYDSVCKVQTAPSAETASRLRAR